MTAQGVAPCQTPTRYFSCRHQATQAAKPAAHVHVPRHWRLTLHFPRPRPVLCCALGPFDRDVRGLYVDDLVASFPSHIKNASQVPEALAVYRDVGIRNPAPAPAPYWMLHRTRRRTVLAILLAVLLPLLPAPTLASVACSCPCFCHQAVAVLLAATRHALVTTWGGVGGGWWANGRGTAARGRGGIHDVRARGAQALSKAPDGSVSIASIGFTTNLEDLLKSGPDDASPLTGPQLVAKKVHFFLMGCELHRRPRIIRAFNVFGWRLVRFRPPIRTYKAPPWDATVDGLAKARNRHIVSHRNTLSRASSNKGPRARVDGGRLPGIRDVLNRVVTQPCLVALLNSRAHLRVRPHGTGARAAEQTKSNCPPLLRSRTALAR